MLVLLTGSTGKVGRQLMDKLSANPRCKGTRIRALWRSAYDLKASMDSTWNQIRSLNEPHRVWCPG
jgi:uncharacterized protein YbjT (DUF2867 family)